MGAKKGVLLVVVLFLGFYMFKDPSGLAELSGRAFDGGWGMTTQFFDATIRFINELF
ncbi:hypothetical protein [Nocardioides alcanivorans]|uniref:hypothetical protein n=1 Tax=Nocardioides alcanivorans TaxID=2897352 RepID=UPI001F2E025C|nr:hypothetical protein [Nocardioides alcanivorans]